nr:MAG: hypothetical protein [Bacteriophage sp.]
MAADFEISALSGTGTATIRVKPKAINEDRDNIKEQILKVVVQGVEREVILVQKANTTPAESWNTYWSIYPDVTAHTFDGTKKGETLEIEVYSYQQKFLNNVPQDEYRAVDWKIETTVDWLEVTQEVGEGNKPGKAIIKTLSRNGKYQSGTYNPIERTGVVKIIQSEKFEKAINITQSPSVRVVTYEIRPVAGLGHSAVNNPAVKTATFRGYIVYTINGEEVATFTRPFRVPKIGETVNGTIPNPSEDPIPWKLWFTNYPSAATTSVDELTCTIHYDCRFFGILYTLVVEAQIQVGDGTVNWVNADEGLRVIPDQA